MGRLELAKSRYPEEHRAQMIPILAEIASVSASVSEFVPGQNDSPLLKVIRTIIISALAIWLTVRVWKSGSR